MKVRRRGCDGIHHERDKTRPRVTARQYFANWMNGYVFVLFTRTHLMLTARVVIETSVQLYPSASPGLRHPGNKRYSVNSDVSHLDKADDSLSRNILSHFLMRLFCVILSR